MGRLLQILLAGMLTVSGTVSCITPISPTQTNQDIVYYKEGFFYRSIDAAVRARIEGKSYRENSNIRLSDLRYVRILYYDFDENIKIGELIVNEKIAQDTVEIFYDLYQHRYPLQEVSLIDKYGASDEHSMRANNTSAFNYRVISGSTSLSKHAYGMAVDINPRINPCVQDIKIQPENGSLYAERNPEECRGTYRDFMIQKGDYIYNLFREHGFQWGGDWKSLKDYQHFEK